MSQTFYYPLQMHLYKEVGVNKKHMFTLIVDSSSESLNDNNSFKSERIQEY